MQFQVAFPVLCWSWAFTLGDRFTVVKRPESWEGARRYCREHFVDLATANTEAHLRLLLEVSGKESGNLWIGLQYVASDLWMWMDGRPMTFDSWEVENPHGGCGSIVANRTPGKGLLPRFCLETLHFICQGAVPPDLINIVSVGTDFVSLSWDRPPPMQGISHSFNVSYSTPSSSEPVSFVTNSTFTLISGLSSGSQHNISVSTVMGNTDQSIPAVVTCLTRLHAPAGVQVNSIQPDLVSLSWDVPEECSRAPCQYNVSYCSLDGGHAGSVLSVTWCCDQVTVSDLHSETEYVISVTAVSPNGAHSVPVTVYLVTSPWGLTEAPVLLWCFQFVTIVLCICRLYPWKPWKHDDPEDVFTSEDNTVELHSTEFSPFMKSNRVPLNTAGSVISMD